MKCIIVYLWYLYQCKQWYWYTTTKNNKKNNEKINRKRKNLKRKNVLSYVMCMVLYNVCFGHHVVLTNTLIRIFFVRRVPAALYKKFECRRRRYYRGG